MLRTAILTAIATIGAALPAQAAIDMRLEEIGGNVVASYSGSIDLTGATSVGTGGAGPFINPGVGALNIFGGPTGVDFYELTSGENFGAEIDTVGGSLFAGDGFGLTQLSGRLVFFETGYAGEFIEGNLTFLGVTLAVLGAEPGTYIYTLPNDIITLTVVDPVPVPAGGVLMATALAGGAFVRRRKTRLVR